MTVSYDTTRPFEDLSGAERVLVFLRDHGDVVDGSGSATRKLADAVLLGHQYVRGVLAELESEGLIAREINSTRTHRIGATTDGLNRAKGIESSYTELEKAADPVKRDSGSVLDRHLAPMPDRSEPAAPASPPAPTASEPAAAALEGDGLDAELEAIRVCVRTLQLVGDHDEDAPARIVGYLTSRFGSSVMAAGDE